MECKGEKHLTKCMYSFLRLSVLRKPAVVGRFFSQ